MRQQDFFGQERRVEPGLRHPRELDCDVIALTKDAAMLRFLREDGTPAEAWSPLSLLRFRGNGIPRKGVQVLEIEGFKARQIGASW